VQKREFAKQPFGVPSIQTASRIDDSDATNAAVSAHFRFTERMRELEMQFQAKASEVRRAYLDEIEGVRVNGETAE
jgi:hypothetical protein